MKKTLALAALLVCVCALPALAAKPVPYLPVPHDAAVILNTGSTNALGYRIVVQRNGEAEYISGATRQKTQLSEDLALAFFANLDAAMPLSQLPAMSCMKSVSFGTRTFVWWRGQRSPDVSCPTNSQGMALNASALKIAYEFGLQKEIFLPPHEPRRPMTEPTPVSSASPSPGATQ
jgi:hypothetical protein